MDENTESQRDQGICPKWHSKNGKARTWNQNLYLLVLLSSQLSRFAFSSTEMHNIKRAIMGQSAKQAILFPGPLCFMFCRKHPLMFQGHTCWTLPCLPTLVSYRLMGNGRYIGVGRVGSTVVYLRRSEISTSDTQKFKFQIWNFLPLGPWTI